jgi:hypothetical protein
MFCSAGCSLSRAKGFSCSLGVRYGDQRINKFQFLHKNFNFGHETLDPEQDPDLQLEKMSDTDPH